MKKSERMQKIVNLNSNLEAAAGAVFSNAQLSYENQLEQLEQLEIYRDEYKKRLQVRCQDSINSGELNDYRFFFSSLEQAIKTQQQSLELLRQNSEERKAQWLEKKNATKKLAKVKDSIKVSEDKAAGKILEMEIDELNNYLRRHPQEGKQY